MQPYALLLIAAAWHAIGIGTVGLRGRIVAGLCGAGFLWGALTPPWGWVQIGAAVGTVTGIRWCASEQGRAGLLAAGAALVTWTADTLRSCWWAVVRVFSPPPTYEVALPERDEPVPVPGDTVQGTPQMMRWTPGWDQKAREVDTAQDRALAPLETYAGVIGDTAAGDRPFNDTARYVKIRFGVSRSKFARDVRAVKGEKAAA